MAVGDSDSLAAGRAAWVQSALRDLAATDDEAVNALVLRVVTSSTDDTAPLRAWWARGGASAEALDALMVNNTPAASQQDLQEFRAQAESAGWCAVIFKKHLVFQCTGVSGVENGIYATEEHQPEVLEFVCNPVQITRWLFNEMTKEHRIVLELTPRHKRTFEVEISQSVFGDPRYPLLTFLAGKGCDVPRDRQLRDCLEMYIAATKPLKAIRTTNRPGWHQNCFVSYAETFVPPNSNEDIVLARSGGKRSIEIDRSGRSLDGSAALPLLPV